MTNAQLATSLRIATSNLHKRLRKQMYSAAGYSMTELNTLFYLSQQPTRLPSELADLNKIKAQSMTKVLQKLETAQLIQRVPQTNDKRKVAISLTEAGNQFGLRIRYERDEWITQVLDQHLAPAQIQALLAALPVLEHIANTP